MTREQQLIWAAGFFDGEGCICITRHKPQKDSWPETYSIDIRVFQKLPEPLLVFRDLFGGGLRPSKNGKCDGWLWVVYGSKIITVLQELEPFLIAKRSQAQLAIEFQGRKVRRGGKYLDPMAVRERNIVDFLRMKQLKVI